MKMIRDCYIVIFTYSYIYIHMYIYICQSHYIYEEMHFLPVLLLWKTLKQGRLFMAQYVNYLYMAFPEFLACLLKFSLLNFTQKKLYHHHLGLKCGSISLQSTHRG